MSKLYIHAGNHKTGTSSIQRFLYENKDYLHSSGLDAYLRGHPHLKGDKSRGNLFWWFDQRNIGIKGAKLKDGFFEDIKEFGFGQDVIASSECFSWIFDPEEIYKIKEQLGRAFSEIKIIFYIRRQDLHAISHFQQSTKTPVDRRFFVGGPRSLPFLDSKLRIYLDYNYRIGAWGDVFGDENIILKVYDKNNFLDGSLIKDFMSIFDIFVPEEKEPSTNASQGWEKTKVKHLMWKAGIKPSDEVSKYIVARLDDEGKMMPSKDSAMEFYRNFEESNRYLNDRFGVSKNPRIFSDDFSMYPEVALDLWDEELANKAINNIFEGVKDYLDAKKMQE
ncbi:hypothetical protein ACJ7V3_01790 [Halomonas elongata]|uniref:hypothetical protein n=1 Tax=Halomonas elongata TaxID=2746 RepID=UPI0038D4B57B